MHPVSAGKQNGLVVRAFLANAEECWAVDVASGEFFAMEKLAPEGFFEGLIPNRKEVFPYRLRARQYNAEIRQFYDPYSFLPTLGELDLHLFNEGNDHRVYEKLGAHIREINGVPGVSFAVWAPNAARVSVVGNFNKWDG